MAWEGLGLRGGAEPGRAQDSGEEGRGQDGGGRGGARVVGRSGGPGPGQDGP